MYRTLINNKDRDNYAQNTELKNVIKQQQYITRDLFSPVYRPNLDRNAGNCERIKQVPSNN